MEVQGLVKITVTQLIVILDSVIQQINVGVQIVIYGHEVIHLQNYDESYQNYS